MSVDDPDAPVMKGFTLVELLVTTAIVLLIAGALLAAVRPAREAFDRVPAELDLQQRARTAIDAIAQSLRGAAIAEVSAGDTALTLVAPIPHSGQGTLQSAQAHASEALMLSSIGCPNMQDVCGLTVGMTAMVTDSDGNADVFTVAAVSIGARSVTANHALSRAYGQGSTLTAVDYYTFSLAQQPDASYSLVRRTYAGAIQPVVDFVSDLTFARATGVIDLSIRVHPLTPSLQARDFKSTLALRSAW